MATKTANVLARVEPEVKSEAEDIMNQLGVPASVVINMLYKQIIIKRKIPFDLSLPKQPLTRSEMTKAQFDEMMQTGLDQAKAGLSRSADDVIADLKKEVGEWAANSTM